MSCQKVFIKCLEMNHQGSIVESLKRWSGKSVCTSKLQVKQSLTHSILNTDTPWLLVILQVSCTRAYLIPSLL